MANRLKRVLFNNSINNKDNNGNDENNSIIEIGDTESDYEPSPAKRLKVTKQSKKSQAEKTKKTEVVVKRKAANSKRVPKPVSSDDDCTVENIEEPRKKRVVRKRKLVDSSEVDGISSSKAATTDTEMGLKWSKSPKKKNTSNAEPTTAPTNNYLPTPKVLTLSSSVQPNIKPAWSAVQLLSDLQHIDRETSANITQLFEEDNTIPFICRYRRELIGNMSPDQLRDIKITYNHIQNIQSRANTIIKDLTKQNVLDNDIKTEILGAKSLDELDHLYAPFKKDSKTTLAERAKALGLGDISANILVNSSQPARIDSFVNRSVEGLETIEKVKDGIKHIIAQVLSKDMTVLEEIRNLLSRENNGIKIHTKQSTSSASTSAKSSTKNANTKGHNNRAIDPLKFETYFNFQGYVNSIQSHQVLAINRGENLKVLTVSVVIPHRMQTEIYKCVRTKYFKQGLYSKEREDLLTSALDEAFTKKITPLMTRQIRSTLTKDAEKASIEVFAKNLKQLLLLHPVKGKKILGIDPGFKNGCKFALISECTDVLETGVIYPHTNTKNSMVYGQKIADLLRKHKCNLIAIGNGTACRETESWISELYKCSVLDSNEVKYCIVSESGASIYSCSDIAKKEFPNLDINLISAVSIARRLSDPLAELVKVEPRHLGVGMYQHDVNEKLLMDSLNEVVMECVSFVGVDINTASVAILRHIAGLTASRAENIINHRAKHGPFKSREELKNVKSIGEKTFLQCAGFIRIEPLTANVGPSYNLLDSTWVHPESYSVAKDIIKKLRLSTKDIGSSAFVAEIQNYLDDNEHTIDQLSTEYGVPEERIKSVLIGLSRERAKDYRDDADIKPLFKKGLQRMSDLKVGTLVTGAISNTTSFGCFVDIGVEHDGLIHVSQLNGKTPTIGDRVISRVLKLDIDRKRIQLSLDSIV